MKKIITAIVLVTILTVVNSVQAAETVTCSTSQYGGSTCGVSTSTETTVTHDLSKIGAGIADWTLAQIIAYTGVTAAIATLLYKKTYRLYIFG